MEVCIVVGEIVVVLGYFEWEWMEQDVFGCDWVCYEYIMDCLILNFYLWLFVDYEVVEQEFDGINLQVFYYQLYDWNVECMIEVLVDFLCYFLQVYSLFQYSQFCILEFLFYQIFVQFFLNMILYLEGIGFIGDLMDLDVIDYVYYVIVYEVVYQWWVYQVMVVNVQGVIMLIEFFVQYFVFMVMCQEYGEDVMCCFFKYELDSYLGLCGLEVIEEQLFYWVENQ